MSKEADNSISFGVGLLAGVVAGVVTGVLLSPKPGDEVRQELKNVADKISDNVPPEVVAAKEVGLEMIEKVRSKMEVQIQKVQEALKAGRLAAAKKREEAETGVDY